jgi:hypothetical protein
MLCFCFCFLKICIIGEGKNLQTEHNAWKRQPKIETITTVIDELNERKARGTKDWEL